MTEPVEQRRQGIAIIGMAGRFPGAASVAEFWENLKAGVEAIRFATPQELEEAGIDPRLRENPDFIPASSTLKDPESFDAAFFGYSAREAEVMDPQQRVFLECAWEALEDAGCDPSRYRGAIGVFAGAGMNTYALNLMTNPSALQAVGAYQAMISNDKDFLASRVAYKMNLRGPAVGIQTACSTSLVATQMAVESLLRRECSMALAGGVSIPLPQPVGYTYLPGMIFSRDGHCRTFDAQASGTVPGAGVGIVVLKRLEEARVDGDAIYAVIRGAAINNDGAAKAGYSAPSVEGQATVIRRSMEMANFSPDSIGFVEAHGTGTSVGDPIEVTALAAAFRMDAPKPGNCVLGALKSNLGHLDAAAGVAGLMKAALTVRDRVLAPTLHFETPNPLIDFAATPFRVSAKPERYAGAGPFRAGVSSFGIGGTNAHVSLEEPPARRSDESETSQLLVLSAKTLAALDRMSQRLSEFAATHPSANLADMAFTLQRGRQAMTHRRTLVAHSMEQVADGFGRAGGPLLCSGEAPDHPRPIAFLFPGQGSQYPNMGAGLYRTSAVYRETFDRCAALLRPHLGADLLDLLYTGRMPAADAERLLARTEYTQPALFAVEYSMAMVWMDLGVEPDAMLGHSVGEYVAACLAGVFSLEDGLALIAARGRMIQAMPAGTMLAVSLPEMDLEPLLDERVSIAAENAPGQSVASGEESAIAELEERLRSRKIECRRLRTSHAFHSPMMEPVAAEFARRVAEVPLHAPQRRYLSNVTGTWITAAQATDPRYWASHLRNAVRFADCGRRLLEDDSMVMLECGPGETLLGLLRMQLPPRSARLLLASMRHPAATRNDREVWLDAVGRLWVAGAAINWEGMHRGEKRLRISLPTYPFERQRYWIESRPIEATTAKDAEPPQKEKDIADWFYLPSWRRTASAMLPVGNAGRNDTWVVFDEPQASGHSLFGKLDLPGTVITVESASQFERRSQLRYAMDTTVAAHYAQLLEQLRADGLWPDHILWPSSAGAALEPGPTIERRIVATMHLVQAIENYSSSEPVALNVLTSAAYSVSGEPVQDVAGAGMHQYAAIAALENFNIKWRGIDLDPTADPAFAASQLRRELLAPPAAEILAYRGTARWVQEFSPVKLPPSAVGLDGAVAIRSGGAYLITGGTGGIGLTLARHLAERYQVNLVLTARTAIPPRGDWTVLLDSAETSAALRYKLESLLALEAAGSRVLVLQADITDATAMQQAVEQATAAFGPLRGIIHASGIEGSGLILSRTAEQVAGVLAAKTYGLAWIRKVLQNASRRRDLDFVLLCSSISAVQPYFGLSDYGAANASLDTFANMMDDPAGARVISVNWDTWAEIGMAVDSMRAKNVLVTMSDNLRQGIRSEEAIEVFDRVLSRPVPQVLVATRSVQEMARLRTMTAAQLHGAAAEENIAWHPAAGASEPLPAAAEEDVEGFLFALWRELLGVETIKADDDFFVLGGHSLLGTQLLSRLRERYRVNLTLRTIFDAPTPAKLAQHIQALRWAGRASEAVESTEREEIEI